MQQQQHHHHQQQQRRQQQYRHQHPTIYPPHRPSNHTATTTTTATTKLPSNLFLSPHSHQSQFFSSPATALWNHPQPPQLTLEDAHIDDDNDNDNDNDDDYSDISSDDHEHDRTYDDVIDDDLDDDSSSAHTHTSFAQFPFPPTLFHSTTPDLTTSSHLSSQRVEDLFKDIARAYAEMVCWLWFSHPTDHFNPANLQRQLQPTDHFVEWLRRVITMTQLSSTVVILSLHYLTKLKKPRNAPGSDITQSSLFNSVNPGRGSEYLVAVVALMLANKVMDDNTYTNKSWAWMCGANLDQINAAEREFLVATRHELHVDQNMLNAWKYVLLGHIKSRASRVASVQAASLHPQVRSTQSQSRQPILRARSASPEPGQFTFTAALPRKAVANPPARRAVRPTSYIGPPPPTQHWLLPESASRSSTGVKRSAEAAFSPRALAARVPHPSERIRQQAVQAVSAVPTPPPRRVYAPAVSRRAHPPPARSGAPHHPPVEFHFAQMSLNGSNHGTPLYPTPPVPSNGSPSPLPLPQLAMPHVPATLPSLDARSAPLLQFYQLAQGGRVLRAATPAGGGRSSTSTSTTTMAGQPPPPPAVRIPIDHHRYPTPSRGPYSVGSSPTERCDAPGCKLHLHTPWSSQQQPVQIEQRPHSASSDSSMQLFPQQQNAQQPPTTFVAPSAQTHTTLPPCRTLLYPFTADTPMYPSPQAYTYSQHSASPALVAEYAQFANAGSPGFHWASTPSSSSTVYRERPSSCAFYSFSSPASHPTLRFTQSTYPTRTVAITPVQQQQQQQQYALQQSQAPRTDVYEYTASAVGPATATPQHQSTTASRQGYF